jgi:hypothetical protein
MLMPRSRAFPSLQKGGQRAAGLRICPYRHQAARRALRPAATACAKAAAMAGGVTRIGHRRVDQHRVAAHLQRGGGCDGARRPASTITGMVASRRMILSSSAEASPGRCRSPRPAA